MRSRSLWLHLVLPIGLVALVATLASLQYRWLGQVSELERERRQTTLRQRAIDMAEAFDRELRTLYQVMVDAGLHVQTGDGPAFARTIEAWRNSARFPGLLQQVYLAKVEGAGATLQTFDAQSQTFMPSGWPRELEPVFRRLTTAEQSVLPATAGRLIMTTRDPVLPAVPAFVVALPTVQSLTVDNVRMVAIQPSSGHVPAPFMAPSTAPAVEHRSLVVRLDRDYVRTEILPALVARHFPNRDADDYRFAVVDPADPATPVFARGLDDGATLDPAKADARVAMFTLRFDSSVVTRVAAMNAVRPGAVSATTTVTTRQQTKVPPAGTAEPPPPPPLTLRPPAATTPLMTKGSDIGSVVAGTMSSSGVFQFELSRDSRDLNGLPAELLQVMARQPATWQLVLQHTSGSLDAAVAQTRRRNLWLSFGILGILGAGVGLIVLNAQRSQRLAAQQMDFVATVSHELRTPLTVIRSAAQNLSAGVVHDNAGARRYGDLIETEGRRLTDMVEQVLEFAGLSGNHGLRSARPLDAAPLVDDVVASASGLFDAEGMAVEVSVAPGLPPIVGDEGALRRAVNNLLTNAAKYGTSGRWVGVSVQAGSAGGRPEVQIAVSDRGRGIEPDDLPHIFEPFYRGRYAIDRQIHGNGLGLSLVKRIAEAHGGRVTVKSAPNEGTTFTLHLPAEPRAPVPVAAPVDARSHA